MCRKWETNSLISSPNSSHMWLKVKNKRLPHTRKEKYEEHRHLYPKKPPSEPLQSQWIVGIFTHSLKVGKGLKPAEPISLYFTEHLTLHMTQHPTSRQLRHARMWRIFFLSLKSSYIRKPALPTFPPLPSCYSLPTGFMTHVVKWKIYPIRCPNDFASEIVISWVMVKSQIKLAILFFFPEYFLI